ncbi:SDR family oxidoreductase [Paraburkholderia azotifigens]|uniref:SDR family oxidoreductase n=1 Tax=Paraburkholderia azotifigens TaxID=2057004 RepID=UPI00316C2107
MSPQHAEDSLLAPIRYGHHEILAVASRLSPGTEEIVGKSIPLHRLGDPRKVAETIYFLSEPASSYINGAEIHINGRLHV